MKDIALSPDYGGVAVILILQASLFLVNLSLVLSKIRFEGQYASPVGSLIYILIVGIAAAATVLLPLRWLLKSVIVWKVCNSGSEWGFKNAASVTGYAYIADLVMAIITSSTLPFLIPEVTINLARLESAVEIMDEYMSQIRVFRFYTLPLIFGGLLWKSYLGGIGTHHSTKQMCTKALGMMVFMLLSLVSLLISYLIT
jgi:hypothetical protein